MGLLESRAIPGVMSYGLSIVHRQKKEIQIEKSSEQTSMIVTLPRLLRECSHALKLHRQRYCRKACSHRPSQRARAAYHGGVESDVAGQPVVRRWGAPGEYPQPSLAREWQAALV